MTEPQPILDSSQPPPLPAPALHALPTRFCGSCGSPLGSDGAACLRCAESSVRLSDPAYKPPTSIAQEIRWVKSSLYLYFALLAICMTATLVALSSPHLLELQIDVVASIGISLIVVAWCIVRPAGILPFLRHTGRPAWYAAALAASFLTFTLASATINLLHFYLHTPVLHYLNMFAIAGVDWRWSILTICLQPALFEELAFRGFIQTSLSRVIGPYEAVFTSALMFAILHCSMPSMPHLFLLGLFTAILRLKSGSLYPGMLLHFSHNFLVLLTEHTGVHFPW